MNTSSSILAKIFFFSTVYHINFFPQESKNFFEGYFVLKLLPKWLARLLISTGLFNLVFKSYAKFGRITLKKVLDDLTEEEELKGIFSYIMGDYGKCNE